MQITTKYKHLLIPLTIVLLIIATLYALGIIEGGEKIQPGQSLVKRSLTPKDAHTFSVKKQASDIPMSWPGTVSSRTVVNIAPKFNARILSVSVNTGDFVKKGEVVAKLDKETLQASHQQALAALNSAQAQAEQAIADEKRTENLYHQDAATRQQFDAAVARAKSARASIKQARSSVRKVEVNLEESTLVAPFDGVISQKLKEPGDMGLPNQAIVIIQNPNNLRLEASIPSHCAKRINLGMSVNVRIDTLKQPLTGRIDEIAPQIDPLTRTQLIKVALPPIKGLVPGLFGWLQQSCSIKQNSILIPYSAITHFGQLEAVKIVTNQQVYTRHIRTGKKSGDLIEVLSGLADGETILIDDALTND